MSEITELDKAIYLMATRAGRDPMVEQLRFTAALNEVRAGEMYEAHRKKLTDDYDARAHQAAYP